MAFVINKKSKKYGKERKLYYLVENYREAGKIKRKTLLKLNDCKNVAELFQRTIQEQDRWVKQLEERKKRFDAITSKKYPQLSPYYDSSELKARFRQKVWGAEFHIKELEKKINLLKIYL